MQIKKPSAAATEGYRHEPETGVSFHATLLNFKILLSSNLVEATNSSTRGGGEMKSVENSGPSYTSFLVPSSTKK